MKTIYNIIYRIINVVLLIPAILLSLLYQTTKITIKLITIMTIITGNLINSLLEIDKKVEDTLVLK